MKNPFRPFNRWLWRYRIAWWIDNFMGYMPGYGPKSAKVFRELPVQVQNKILTAFYVELRKSN